MLKSFSTVEEAITVIQQLKGLSSNEGFNLTKLISNNRTVLKSIPDEIIQQLCQDKLQWDEQIDERSTYEWLKWKNNLLTLENVTVPRCYKLKDFGKNITYSLHHFSDASESGYGQASYLRMENENGDTHCCLIFGRSRVAPVKYVSIPRLELTPATLSVKISMMLKEELDIHISSELFWTDSQVVLGYINNASRRFKTFIANCVQFNQDHTDVQQWQYLSAHDNTTDDTFHGLDSKNLSEIQRWFNGPAFLWSSEKTWLHDKHSNKLVNEDDLELKNKLQLNIVKADITVT